MYNRGVMSYLDVLKEKARLHQRIRDYKAKNPDITLQEIGNKFGLTRQRISQILKTDNGSK